MHRFELTTGVDVLIWNDAMRVKKTIYAILLALHHEKVHNPTVDIEISTAAYVLARKDIFPKINIDRLEGAHNLLYNETNP